ncbi:hypothetical protein IAD21_00056 [Abditibacteriota bacterium]|nr:hypothetical protein IAD21_00056 [Abditibacteriota bacterium]
MKTRDVTTWIALAGATYPQTGANSAPHSGYLETATMVSATNPQGQFVQQKLTTRLWFSGSSTRLESWQDNQLLSIEIEGPAPQTYFPKAKRSMDTPMWLRKKTPYSQQVLADFPLYSRSPPLSVQLKGLPCWKYSWHEPERTFEGDRPSIAAYDATYWIYADKQLPFVLQYAMSDGSKSELVNFGVNRPVSADTFQVKGSYRPILPFTVPPGPFTLEITEEHAIQQNSPSTIVTTQTFQGDEKQIKRTYSGIVRESDGRERNRLGPDREIMYLGGSYLNQVLRLSQWDTVDKVGEETLPLGRADIFQRVVGGPSLEKYWIVDHPLWGSIIAQQVSESHGMIITRRITRLEIGSNFSK